jgi:F-type H+-transporting ATPase subunit epsilon
MNTFLLEIATPERLAYSEDVEQVTVPSTEGEITVLPHHVNIFATLAEGEIVVQQKGERRYVAIGGGFIEVTPKKTIILVTRAAHADELNEAAILKAQKDAQESIEKGATGDALKTAQTLLRSTLVDLKVVRRRKRTAN